MYCVNASGGGICDFEFGQSNIQSDCGGEEIPPFFFTCTCVQYRQKLRLMWKQPIYMYVHVTE